MRKFPNIIEVVIILFLSQSAFAQEVPAWIRNPKTPYEEFVAKMLASESGDKNWVYCYRCALGRSDIDKIINESNCLKVYKIWNSKSPDEIKVACH